MDPVRLSEALALAPSCWVGVLSLMRGSRSLESLEELSEDLESPFTSVVEEDSEVVLSVVGWVFSEWRGWKTLIKMIVAIVIKAIKKMDQTTR